jgi:FkbM family methyltransferase
MAAKRAGPNGAVHAFEPSPEEYDKLCSNVALNHLTNVVTNRVAVCDRIGQVRLQICGDGLGLYNSLGRPLNPVARCVSVPCTTLDSYIQSAGIAKVDFLKIDVEGAELACLKGAAGLLSGPEAPIIICEFCDASAAGFGHSTRDLRRHLETLGYRVFRYHLAEHRLRPEPYVGGYSYDNLICVKKESSDGQLASGVNMVGQSQLFHNPERLADMLLQACNLPLKGQRND